MFAAHVLSLIFARAGELDLCAHAGKVSFPNVSGADKTGLKHLERLGLQNKDGIKVSPQLNNRFSNWVIGSQS